MYAELNFSSFLRDIENLAPEEPVTKDTPRQAPQIQLQEVARAKSEAKRRAKLEGQGDLFAMFDAPTTAPEPTSEPETVAEEVEEIVGIRNIGNTLTTTAS